MKKVSVVDEFIPTTSPDNDKIIDWITIMEMDI